MDISMKENKSILGTDFIKMVGDRKQATQMEFFKKRRKREVASKCKIICKEEKEIMKHINRNLKTEAFQTIKGENER